jgi:hypothetical protein
MVVEYVNGNVGEEIRQIGREITNLFPGPVRDQMTRLIVSDIISLDRKGKISVVKFPTVLF